MASPYRHPRHEDLYSPLIVEDLLGGANEWRNVQDIIRLTFKALSDVVRTQAASLRELERQMATKVSKTDLNSGLAVKANVSDITRTVKEVFSSLESKLNLDDLQALVGDKVSRSEVQYLLSSKAPLEAVEIKADKRTVDSELHALRVAIDETQKEMARRHQQTANQRDIQQIYTLLDTKANSVDIEESLQTKANKQSVANALHKKANRVDVDSLLARKADLAELQSVLMATEGKADQAYADRILQNLELKVDRSELSKVIMNEAEGHKHDQDDLEHRLFEVQQQETQVQEQLEQLERFASSLRQDLDEQRLALASTSSAKADKREVERVTQALLRKADADGVASSFAQARQELQDAVSQSKKDSAVDRKNTEDRTSRISTKLERLEQDIGRIGDGLSRSLTEYKAQTQTEVASLQNIAASSRADVQELAESLDRNKADLESLNARKAERADFAEFRLQVAESLSGKAEVSALQEAKLQQHRDLMRSVGEVREDLRSLVAGVESELSSLIDKKASLTEMQTSLSDKADLNTLHRLAASRVTAEELEELKAKFDLLGQELLKKAEHRDVTMQLQYSREAVDDLHKELTQRPTVKDVLNLVDSKASLAEVERSLTRLAEDIGARVPKRELQELMQEQQQIVEALCAENCTARWIWKTGNVRPGYAVPWEVQSVNTCPDNFLWERDKTSILLVAPGLYEVSAGFYASSKPTIQLLVNGEMVLTDPKEDRGKQFGRHPAGNVIGVTFRDFLALPARARVAVSYVGDPGAEGFLGLRKL
jgi:hypothetical protein